MDNEELLSILGKTNASGSFVARIDGKEFLQSNSFEFLKTNEEYIIVGNDDNKNGIAFAVPNWLAAEVPHTVDVYPGFITWNVRRDGVSSNVESGSATVTLAKNLQSVSGTVAFILPDGSNVTGEFAINRL